MAIGTTTSSTISAIVNTIIAEARFTMMHDTVWLPHVRKYSLPKGSSTITVPKFGTVTAQSLTEGVDMANPTKISPSTSLTLTAAEVGCQVLLTDVAVKYGSSDINRAAGRLQGQAMAKKLDQDLAGNVSSFTTHSLASSSTPMTPGLISAAYYRLIGQSEPAPGPLVGIMHPYTLKDLADTLTQLAAVSSSYAWYGGASSPMAQKILTAGFQGVTKLFNIPIYASGNISTTSGSLNTVMSKEAVCIVEDENETTEEQRDASLRATEINHVRRYGYGVYQESYGVLITIDATAPTT